MWIELLSPSDSVPCMTETKRIRDWNEFEIFHHESVRNMLGKDPPAKEQEFFLFRGVKAKSHELVSSLARKAGALEPGEGWRKRIPKIERGLLNRFLSEVEPYSDRLKEQ